MSFLVSLCLMLVSIVLLVVGFSASLSWAFVAAALVSAGAVVILWRRVSAEKEHTFVTDPPERREPKMSEPLLEPEPVDPDGVLDLGEAHTLGIPGYDQLVAAEILPSLETLSVEQLRAVIARERRGLRRGSVVQRAQRLIELTGPSVTDEDASLIPTRAPARKSQKRSKDGPEISL